ncbi:MAG: hypothetical protein ACFE85_09950 [Candidatus Hodarchaeota archaeon]
MKKKIKTNTLFFLLILSILLFPIQIVSISQFTLSIQPKVDLTSIEMPKLSSSNNWPSNGRIICNEGYDQLYPQVCSDGADGAIITWLDERSGTFGDIYAQLVNSTGDVRWAPNGVAISTENDTQGGPQICNDGIGGAIITWHDKRNGLFNDIYAQKINSTGDIQWVANGTVISTAEDDQVVPQICSDEAGGAVIIWNDYRSVKDYDIYVQRINSSGDVKWNANGTAICTEGGDQYFPQISSDNAGGAILAWEDYRGGKGGDIYAQKINSSGDVKWDVNGTVICMANDTQGYLQITTDGAGGAIITWADYRNGMNFDIYAQRIDSTGNVKWTPNGAIICGASGNQATPQICSDGAGGAIITWADWRIGSNGDIYTQRIDSTGNVKWTVNGVAICRSNADQDAPQITSDGNGGAIITWQDLRNVWEDVYAQRIDSTGNVIWVPDGVVICNASYAQRRPQIISRVNRSAIITWFDKRNGANYDIYANLIEDIPYNGDDGDGRFPIEIVIIISSTCGGIALLGVATFFILKRRRKIEQ